MYNDALQGRMGESVTTAHPRNRAVRRQNDPLVGCSAPSGNCDIASLTLAGDHSQTG